jgi:transposase
MSCFYPSNISREQFAHIAPILESARKKTRPRTLDLYDVFCGVLYVLKSGCQWRMVPKDFPKWRSCYEYFKQWSAKPSPYEDSILDVILKQLVGNARLTTNRPLKTSFLIIDAQSVKNTDTAKKKATMRGRKCLA